MQRIVTVDGGNSAIKTLVDGEHALIFDNIIADPSKVNYRQDPDLIGAGIQKLDVTVTRHHDRKACEKSRFLFGKITDKYRAYREPRIDTFKATDPRLVEAMLTSIVYSILYFDKKQGKDISRTSTLRVRLGTGLPFHEWMVREQKERFIGNLLGNHMIEFNHPWFKMNGFPTRVELIIDYVKVSIEGETTANLLLNKADNDFQNLSPQELLNSVVVLIDVGAYTTEIIGKQYVEVVSNEEDMFSTTELVVEHQTLPALSEGVRRGIGHAMEDTIRAIKEKHPELDKLIRQDIQYALSTKGMRGGVLGYLPGTDINILGTFTEQARHYADYIAQRIEDIYNKNESKNQIKRIYITGGGSRMEIVVEQLKEALSKIKIPPHRVIAIADPNPVFANCIGAYLELLDELNEKEASGEIA